MEATPQSEYDAQIRERRRLEEAANIGGLVSSYIMRTAVQLELPLTYNTTCDTMYTVD